MIYTSLPLGVCELRVETTAGLRATQRATVDGATGSEVPIPVVELR